MEKRYITDDLSDIETADLLKALPDYFDDTGDINNTAYLNWRFDFTDSIENKFFDMGKGYFQTSLALIDACLSNNQGKKADIWIFPIMFNIVHGIEVYLKGFKSQYRIYTKLQRQENQDSKIEGNHDIHQLCQEAISQLKANKDSELLKEFSFLHRFIEILYKNTNDMTFARYPITSKGDSHFYVDKTDNITIDLNVFKAWATRVYKILDTCTSSVDYQIDDMREFLYEMQQEYGYYY